MTFHLAASSMPPLSSQVALVGMPKKALQFSARAAAASFVSHESESQLQRRGTQAERLRLMTNSGAVSNFAACRLMFRNSLCLQR
ncbi:unnamed protein product [Nippostrongylus brasiliensis]|uniref:Secreted protein n=1 Tax=Nippostrongylus brasiliensis TaxID=27835 RepID=A0A0N4XEP0_NIPBR|nr:unnamed protein product [Nippostrongylus brasiliensis]